MNFTDRKTKKNNWAGLILCALFALAALALWWINHDSGVSASRSSGLLGAVNSAPVSIVISAVYVLVITLGGLLNKNKPIRIASCSIACLMAACRLIPLLAKTFGSGAGFGITQLIECLRCVFLIAMHALIVINVACSKGRGMQRMESLLLCSALVIFVSSIVLTLFASPESPVAGQFKGLANWTHFFPDALRFSPAAFRIFDESAASLIPICDGAVLLLLYRVMRIYNLSFGNAAEKQGCSPIMEMEPILTIPEKPAASFAANIPAADPAPAAPVRSTPVNAASANSVRTSAPFISKTAAEPAKATRSSFITKTAAEPTRTAPVNPVRRAPANVQNANPRKPAAPAASAFTRKAAEPVRSAAVNPVQPAARKAPADGARLTASGFILKTSAEPTRTVLIDHNAPRAAARSVPTDRSGNGRAMHSRSANQFSTSEAGGNVQDQLQNLANLRNRGAISDEEFYRRKRDLMGK